MTGASATPTGLSPSVEPASSLDGFATSIPSADRRTWFCERGGFWGTVKQLLLCARCGKNEFKRRDELRHYAGVFTSKMHMVCDDCFESLPDDAPVTTPADDELRRGG